MVRSKAVMISGVRIDPRDLGEAADLIIGAGLTHRAYSVHLCNAYVLALAARQPQYAEQLSRGDLNLADGAPVAWFASRAGLKARNRPSGTELLHEVFERGAPQGVLHYLYGSTPQVVADMAGNLERLHPSAQIVGVEAPAFGPVTASQARQLALAATNAGAHVIWVGLGTPKQDELIDELRERFRGVCVPVGAAFDFVAGTTPRANRWLRRFGLEWLHRLAADPRRLWRRYLIDNFRFLWALLRTGRVIPGIGEDRA